MGMLDHAVCYMSGAIEMAKDHGVGWRKKIIELSRQAGLKIDYIDPTEKPGEKHLNIGENVNHQARLQQEGKWRELRDYVRNYRRSDLRFVDISDFIIVSIDPTIAQWGTANELYVADSSNSRVVALPLWLFDVVDLDDLNVYDSLEGIVSTLVDLNEGEEPLSDKWVLAHRIKCEK